MHQHRGRRVVFALAVSGDPARACVLEAARSFQLERNKRHRLTTQRPTRAIAPKGATTADQQKENSADREITQKIRSAIMDDKTLSTYAHNVKIVTQNGQVTLKGPVRTEDEKKTVETKATEVAGAGHVTNQISIAPAKDSKQ